LSKLEFYRKKSFKILEEGGEIIERFLLESSDNETDVSLEKDWKLNVCRQVEVKEARNPQFHRKYMKLIRFFFDNLPEKFSAHIRTFEQARVILEFEIGNYETYWTIPTEKEVFDKERFISMFDSKKKYGIETITAAMELANVTKMVPRIQTKHKSIAFDKMTKEEFEDLYNRMLAIVSRVLDTGDEVLRKELEGFGE